MAASGTTRRQPEILRFAEFELDPGRATLSRRGTRRKLQPQPLQVLTLLIRSAPGVVSRDTIRRHVWGDGVHVDADASINFCIRQIRLALTDTSNEPRFLETVPREGYRFIGVLEKAGGEDDQKVPDYVGAEVTPGKQAIRFFPTAVWLLAGLVLAATFIVLLRPARDATVHVLHVRPVTTETGSARDPSLSPDGLRVAYSWSDEDGIDHIYVKQLADKQTLNLTQGKNRDRFPAWSPDGTRIAFVRHVTDEEGEILSMSPLGGHETVLRRVKLGPQIAATERLLAWTKNGERLCFTDQTAAGRNRLFLLSLDDGSVQPLRDGSPSDLDESSPAFSPDGKWVAFVRFFGSVNTDLVIQRLNEAGRATGEASIVSGTLGNPMSPVWLANAKDLLFIDEGNIMQATIGHAARNAYAATSQLHELAYDARHSRLIASVQAANFDIWSVPLKRLTVTGNPKLLVRSTQEDGHPIFSPDGQWLAFRSDRSGAGELWVADSRGKNPRQLTHLRAYIVGYPHWSPDGKLIVFHARTPRDPQLYIVRVEDGALRQLTNGKPGFGIPSFSADGKKVYCTQATDGWPYLYRVDVDSGTPEPLWYGSSGIEAPGRNLLVYLKPGEPGLYARALRGHAKGNPETQLISDYVRFEARVYPTLDGILYMGRRKSDLAFRFYSFTTQRSLDIMPLNSSVGSGFAFNPDRSTLVFDANTGGEHELVEVGLR